MDVETAVGSDESAQETATTEMINIAKIIRKAFMVVMVLEMSMLICSVAALMNYGDSIHMDATRCFRAKKIRCRLGSHQNKKAPGIMPRAFLIRFDGDPDQI